MKWSSKSSFRFFASALGLLILSSCQTSKISEKEKNALDQVLVLSLLDTNLQLSELGSKFNQSAESVVWDASDWKINERIELEFRKRLSESGKKTWSLKPQAKKEILKSYGTESQETFSIDPRRVGVLREELIRRYLGLGTRYLLLISSEKFTKPYNFLRESSGIVCLEGKRDTRKHWIYISYKSSLWDMSQNREIASFVPKEPYKIETPETACDFYTEKNKSRVSRYKDRFIDVLNFSVTDAHSQMGWYDGL